MGGIDDVTNAVIQTLLNIPILSIFLLADGLRDALDPWLTE
jgi:hypothetical protein